MSSHSPVDQKKRAAEVTEAGFYQWIDQDNHCHIGTIERDNKGRLSGTFVGISGNIRAISLCYGPQHFCEGWFFGPISPASQP